MRNNTTITEYFKNYTIFVRVILAHTLLNNLLTSDQILFWELRSVCKLTRKNDSGNLSNFHTNGYNGNIYYTTKDLVWNNKTIAKYFKNYEYFTTWICLKTRQLVWYDCCKAGTYVRAKLLNYKPLRVTE